MNRLVKRPKLFVYQKIIVVFVALIIPVYLINLWMNTMGRDYIKDEYINSIKSNVKFYSAQLDDQISFIRNLQLQFLNDSNLQKLSFLADTLEGYEEVQLVNRIKEQLATIHYSSSYLVNVGVYMKAVGKTISTKNGLSGLPNTEFDMVSKLFSSNPKPSVYYEDGRLFFIEGANNNSIIVYMELSRAKLEETLNQLVKYYNDAGSLLVDDQFSYNISHKDEESIMKGLMDSVPKEPTIDEFDSYIHKIGNKSYRVTYNRISALGLTLFAYLNENEVIGPLKKFNVWFIVLPLLSIVVILIYSFSINVMMHRPLKKLMKAFNMLETDNLDVSIEPRGNDEFGYLYRSFNRMIEKLKQSILQNYEQKIALQRSELKQLQSQINPHFLYNSFFNIYMICNSGDSKSASILAQKLGSYYQFITRSGSDEVPLDQEYRHALDYCDIQSIRFSNRIQVNFAELPEKCKPFMVPRLIIQPVVENAFEHAFENGIQRGTVYISITFENNRLSIYVEDDGNAMTDESLHILKKKLINSSDIQEKTGLINVCQRIRLKYGDESGIFVSRSEYGGFKAEIVILFHHIWSQ